MSRGYNSQLHIPCDCHCPDYRRPMTKTLTVSSVYVFAVENFAALITTIYLQVPRATEQ